MTIIDFVMVLSTFLLTTISIKMTSQNGAKPEPSEPGSSRGPNVDLMNGILKEMY